MKIVKELLEVFYYLACNRVKKYLTEEEQKRIPLFEVFIKELIFTDNKIQINKRLLPRAENGGHIYRYRKCSYIMEENKDKLRCLARIRNARYGGQCEKSANEKSECYLCTSHDKKYKKYGYLYYGFITEKRYIRYPPEMKGRCKIWLNAEEEEENLIGVLRC